MVLFFGEKLGAFGRGKVEVIDQRGTKRERMMDKARTNDGQSDRMVTFMRGECGPTTEVVSWKRVNGNSLSRNDDDSNRHFRYRFRYRYRYHWSSHFRYHYRYHWSSYFRYRFRNQLRNQCQSVRRRRNNRHGLDC